VEKMTKDYWDKKWDNRQNEPPNNFAKRAFLLVKDKGYKTLLDVGCGIGRDSIFFAKSGFQVTSIDFSKGGIVDLKKKADNQKIKNLTVKQMDITDLKFDDKKFDVIYAHLTLHYFDDKTTTQIFDKLYRILKPNGTIFIKCKSTDDALFGQGKKVGENMFKKGHTRHFFDKQYMKEKLNKFTILKIKKTSSVYHKYKSAFIEAVATK
jgi:ubiquinone/menaquinone biosynthesis C-methylase UbiE